MDVKLLWAQGLWNWDEHPANVLVVYGTLPLLRMTRRSPVACVVCWQPAVSAVQPAAEDNAAVKELRDSFKKIAGEDMEIDAYELQDILNAAFAKGK